MRASRSAASARESGRRRGGASIAATTPIDFDHLRDERGGDAKIAVPALLHDGEQLRFGEAAQVLAGGLRRDAGDERPARRRSARGRPSARRSSRRGPGRRPARRSRPGRCSSCLESSAGEGDDATPDTSSAGEATPQAFRVADRYLTFNRVGGIVMPITQISTIVASAANRIVLWCARARERHALSELDEYLLRDVGLTRSEAHRESVQPFWRGDDRQVIDRRESMSPNARRESLSRHGVKAFQPRFVAFSEKESARRGWLSGRRNRPRCSVGTIIGKRLVWQKLVLVQPIEREAGLAERGDDVGERVDPFVAARDARSAACRRCRSSASSEDDRCVVRRAPGVARYQPAIDLVQAERVRDGFRRDRESRRAPAPPPRPAPSEKCRAAS